MNALIPADHTFVAPRERYLRDECVLDIGIILVHGFDFLALMAVTEPFRVANRLSQKERFRISLMSVDGLPVVSAQGVPMVVEAQVSVEKSHDLTLVCAGDRAEETGALSDKIRRMWRRGRKVGAIHGGIFILVQAGILGSHRFAAHFDHIPIIETRWPHLEPMPELYCIDRRILTCAGGVASADLALRLINEHGGAALARNTMQTCMITAPRGERVPQTASVAPRVQSRNPALLKAVSWIDEHFLDADCLDHLPAMTGSSVRQIQRLFRAHLGIRPLQYLTDLRLNHARVLLAETEMSVQDVALTCCYTTSGSFAKPFRQKFGVAPSKYSPFGSSNGLYAKG